MSTAWGNLDLVGQWWSYQQAMAIVIGVNQFSGPQGKGDGGQGGAEYTPDLRSGGDPVDSIPANFTSPTV